MPPKAQNLAENLTDLAENSEEQLEQLKIIEKGSNAMQILMHANDKLMNFINSLKETKVSQKTPKTPKDFKEFNLKFTDGTTIQSIEKKLQPVKEENPINILNEQYLKLLSEYLNDDNDNILTQYKKLLHHLITPPADATQPVATQPVATQPVATQPVA